jgi:Raf kinase inhibitor-like YbhB/YbcL family protein
MRRIFGVPFTVVLSCVIACGFQGQALAEGGSMKITSPAFSENGMIPAKFTCDGGDINPVLVIENIPVSSKSLALIVDDPDAPMGTWVHWVVYNIPVVSRIDENSVPGILGDNDFGRKQYGGPCPPGGTHRYFFKIYALDAVMSVSGKVTKRALEDAMQGHIIEKAQTVGLYKR